MDSSLELCCIFRIHFCSPSHKDNYRGTWLDTQLFEHLLPRILVLFYVDGLKRYQSLALHLFLFVYESILVHVILH